MPSITKGRTAVNHYHESQARLAAKEAAKPKPLPVLNPVEIEEPKPRAVQYSDEDREYIFKVYANTPNDVIGAKVGRNAYAIGQFAYKHGLKKSAEYLSAKSKPKPSRRKVSEQGELWTEKQTAILKDNYATMQTRDLAVILGVTRERVSSKAVALGLRKDKKIICEKNVQSVSARWAKHRKTERMESTNGAEGV